MCSTMGIYQSIYLSRETVSRMSCSGPRPATHLAMHVLFSAIPLTLSRTRTLSCSETDGDLLFCLHTRGKEDFWFYPSQAARPTR